jgi:hypothetical protein
LKDEGKRRAYDLIYPSITRSRASAHKIQTLHAPPQAEAYSEAAQIAALQRLKRERAAQWRCTKNVFKSSIFELQRDIQQLEQEIKDLESILAAEAAKAWMDSWIIWFLSPIYKKVEDSDEEKARKDRGRQERRIERDMKERQLESKRVDLKALETILRKGQRGFDAADLGDDCNIEAIQNLIWIKEDRETQRREMAEQERLVKIQRQRQEQWEEMSRKAQADRRAAEQKRHEEEIRRREAAEAAEASRKQQADREAAELKRREEEFNECWEAAQSLREQQAEERAAEQRRHDETERHWAQYTHTDFSEKRSRRTYTSNCCHDAWWLEVQGRTACPECDEVWTYLLECPGCEMKACPRCQATIRPRARRVPLRVLTPSSTFAYDWYD